MLHGVNFENVNTEKTIHTAEDWGLILAPREIKLPSVQTNYVQITGRDGSLDLTEALGEVKYNNREFSLKFSTQKSKKDYNTLITQISNFIHGGRFKITIYSEEDFYYIGRCTLDNFQTDKNTEQITINCVCEPYKYKKEITSKTINVFEIENNKFEIENSRMTAIPKIINAQTILLNFENTDYSLQSGEHIIPSIALKEGTNTFEVKSGSGNITFVWQEGTL